MSVDKKNKGFTRSLENGVTLVLSYNFLSVLHTKLKFFFSKILLKKPKTTPFFSAGFTLVELIVASGIFVSVMIVAVGALLTTIDANRKSHELRNVIDNVTFAIESISKGAQGSNTFVCGTVDNLGNVTFNAAIPNCPAGGPAVQYNTSGTTTQYRFRLTSNLPNGESNLQKRVCPGGSCTISNLWQDMVAPYPIVKMTNLKFYVLGEGTDGSLTPSARRQPRIIITAEGEVAGKTGTSTTKFNLQTTTTRYKRYFY